MRLTTQEQQHDQESQQRQYQHQVKKYYSQVFNRNNSNSNCYTSVAILICLLASGITKTNAVPTDSRIGIASVARSLLLHRELRDAATMTASLVQEDTAALKDTATTSTETLDQPQGQCLLDGILVAETTVFCEKQVGCRAIQKTGHCCPDYKCDCEKDGKTYLNGDKLVDPETPCTVCYCQGGEILCSKVSCYHRDDCKPKYIPGRCCPEYDNCPVSKTSTTNNTLSSNDQSSSTTLKPEVPASALNTKITIKEITKPTEIRIYNKAVHQMPTTLTTTTTTTTTKTTKRIITTTTLSSPILTTPTTPTPTPVPMVLTTSTPSPSPPSPPSPPLSPTFELSKEINNESSLKALNSLDNNNLKTLRSTVGINNGSLKLSASVAYPVTQAPSPSSSSSLSSSGPISVNENFDENMGSNDEKSISILDTPGLQQVESEFVNDSNKVNIKREYFVSTEGISMAPNAVSETVDDSDTELTYGNVETVHNGSIGSLHQPLAEIEPDTAGSDNIYHIILTTDGPRVSSSTESYLAIKGSNSMEEFNDDNNFSIPLKSDTIELDKYSIDLSSKSQMTTDAPIKIQTSTQAYASSTNQYSEENSTKRFDDGQSSMTTDGQEYSTSTEFNSKSTTETLHHLDEDDITIPLESNPAYPSLPEDDFSLRETDDIPEIDIKDEPRSIGGSDDTIKSTKHLDENLNNLDGSGSGMGINIDSPSSTTDYMIFKNNAMSLTKIADKIPIVYSAEDSSAETSISNNTDFHVEKATKEGENETGSGEPLEMDAIELLMGSSGSGSGSGSGELLSIIKMKQREYTTPRPTRKIDVDIDELGASGDGNTSPSEDPKLDVESLKLNDDDADGVGKGSDTAIKGNVLSVKTYPIHEKAIEDVDINKPIKDAGVRVQRLYYYLNL